MGGQTGIWGKLIYQYTLQFTQVVEYGTSAEVVLSGLARRRKCGRLEWWVLDWNRPATEFYRSIGAMPMEGRTVHRVAGEALDRLGATGGR